MTRKHVLLLLGLWLFAGPLAAVPLWSVEQPHSAGTVLLLGSVHALRSADQPLPAAVHEAYRQAARLVMELDPEELRPEASLAALTRIGIVTPGHAARDVLSEEEWQHGRALVAEAGLELEDVAPLEPWFAAITLYTGALAAAGYRPEYGVEHQVAAWAAGDDKPVTGLETIEEQLLLFKDLAADQQRAMLLKTLDELAEVGSETEALVALWRAGDVAGLAGVLAADFRDFEALRERIVSARNHAWRGRIEALLDMPGTTLVVVGALHLVGPDGLPRLLAERGLVVTAVPPTVNQP